MRAKRSSRLQLAVDSVTTGISRGTFRPGEFLPGIRALSEAAQVSRETMWKAVQQLREQGVLAGESGHRFTVRGEAGDSDSGMRTPSLSSMEKWRRVRENIQRDVLNGVYLPDGLLPSLKELSERYGVTRATLRKAFSALEDEHIVMPCKGTYRLLPVSPLHAPHIGITAIGKADEMYWEYWHREMYRSLSVLCSRSNIRLSTLGFVQKGDRIEYVNQPFREPTQLVDPDDTAGYILHITGPQTFHEETARQLVSYRKPIALLDETGGWQLPDFMRSSPFVHVFTMTTSRRAARNVARYLLSKGHRHVAFVAPYHKAAWSVNRLEGLATAYAEAGLPAQVTARTLNHFTSRSEYIRQGSSRSKVSELERFYTSWKEGLPPAFSAHTDRAMRLLAMVACPDGEINCQLEHIFEDLLHDPSITAWVMVNDYSARMAEEYLRARNMPVPGRISLVSFDDTPDAVEFDITSYNFNLTAVVNAMVSYIVRFRSDTPGKPGKTTEIEGFMVERRSCAKIPDPGDRG